jgi:citrate lyase alpha subunit
MALANSLFSDANPISHFKPGVLDGLFSAGYLAAIKSHYSLGSPGRFHHAVDMRADTGQAVNMADTQHIEAHSYLVGYLAAVGTPRAGEYGNVFGFTGTFFCHINKPSLSP